MTLPIADNAATATVATLPNGDDALTLSAVYIGGRTFRYWITYPGHDMEPVTVMGEDLHCAAAGPIPDNDTMLQSLANFLQADGETYAYFAGAAGADYMFGEDMASRAYTYSDELGMFAAGEDTDTDD